MEKNHKIHVLYVYTYVCKTAWKFHIYLSLIFQMKDL